MQDISQVKCVDANWQSFSFIQGAWSKRRQTKTAKVKTATFQNGDKRHDQNGDKSTSNFQLIVHMCVAQLTRIRSPSWPKREFPVSILLSFVAVLTTRLCRRFGYVPVSLSPFWIVAVLVSPFWLSPFWFVAVLTILLLHGEVEWKGIYNGIYTPPTSINKETIWWGRRGKRHQEVITLLLLLFINNKRGQMATYNVIQKRKSTTKHSDTQRHIRRVSDLNKIQTTVPY